MKTKFLFYIMFFVVVSSTLTAQQSATDRKATIISGSVSFSNQIGDLFSESKNLIRVSFAPNVNRFVLKNLFIGGGLEFLYNQQYNFNSNAIAIGPQIGYTFGNSNGPVLPYVDLGIRYYNMKQVYFSSGVYKLSGSQIEFGFGAIVPLKTHIGLIFQGGYQIVELKRKEFDYNTSGRFFSGRIFSIGIGIAGLIFKDVK